MCLLYFPCELPLHIFAYVSIGIFLFLPFKNDFWEMDVY